MKISTSLKWAFVLAMTTGMSGCSSLSKAFNWGDSVWGSDRDYRQTEAGLADALDVPPSLVKPRTQDSLALLNAREAAMFEQGKLPSQVAQLSKRDIPSYKAKGVAVRGNLTARWLALEGVSADTVWEGVQRFLRSLGYEIKEANRATGIIRTAYLPRKEIVPMVDVSPLTRLLNKWRPEVAEGAMDRFTVHVTAKGDSRQAQVLFHHHQVFKQSDDNIDVYTVKPYDPVKELEMLYQSAIFFGASKEAALKQVQVSAHTVEIVQGSELRGLKLHAPLSESWAYLQSMIWRADWNVEKVMPERHQMVVNLQPEKEKEGFWSKLAFWRKRNNLPEQVILTLAPLKGQPNMTLLTVDPVEATTPLTADQRKAIFRQLGLLAQ